MVGEFINTRPKPAYGRQGLDSDRWARIQFSQVHFGAKTSRNQQGDPTDLLWCKNVTSPTGGSNRGTQPKTMKNHETTLKNHGNQPKTMRNHETTM